MILLCLCFMTFSLYFHVDKCRVISGENSEQRKENHRNKWGNRQGERLKCPSDFKLDYSRGRDTLSCHLPVDSHQEDAVGTSQSLANLGIDRQEEDGREDEWRQKNHPGTPEYSNEILQRSFLKDKSYEKMTKVWPSKNILALFIFRNREILTTS